MIEYQEKSIHWNFYLALEQDLELISRYIEFSKLNEKTFSIELARIIMSASQEVDVILKNLCKLLKPEAEALTISDYRIIIQGNLPQLIEENIYIPRFGLCYQPWLNWGTKNSSPYWWTANNNIKHNRTTQFKKAHLKNAINAMGALLIVNLYFYKKKLEKEKSKSFDWKEITSKIKSKNSFLKLKNEYYNE